ncbi:MAG: nucleotide exchange factor GrpE [Firmicutes bacterium]|nr:nucleotide exchange factor GrpE [Bacillota bacterium]
MAETPAAAAATGADTAPASEATLREHLARLKAERDELFQTLIRRQADFENYRKRIERERHEDAERVAARVVTDLLPVLDAVERALASLPGDGEGPGVEYRRGFELIQQQLHHLLERYKVTRIPAVGRQFDPHVHQAIERVETDQHPEGTVLEELQAGYTLRDRVLRPSVVRVAALPPAPAETKAQ